MKILFVTKHVYLPQRAGGSESTTHDLCNGLLARKHQCAVLSGLQFGDKIWMKNRILSKTRKIKAIADNIMGYPVFRDWFPEEAYCQVIDQFKPDIAVVQAGQPMMMANGLLNLGVKTIVYVHDVEFKNHGGEYQYKPNLYFLANSQFTAYKLQEEFGLLSKVIPPLVQLDNYKVNSKKEKVLFINPVRVKGVELSFKLAEKNPDIPFLFVESWNIEKNTLKLLKKRAKSLGNIEWKEKQKDMKKIYGLAKLLIAPSLWQEAWGRVITEAQASGIPCLASNRGGLPESVGDGGITLDPEDFQSWHDNLRQLWFDETTYQTYSKQASIYGKRQSINPEFLLNEFIQFVEKTL